MTSSKNLRFGCQSLDSPDTSELDEESDRHRLPTGSMNSSFWKLSEREVIARLIDQFSAHGLQLVLQLVLWYNNLAPQRNRESIIEEVQAADPLLSSDPTRLY